MALAGVLPQTIPAASASQGTPIRSKTTSSALSSQSGYRFGHRSLNSFFARHNPHPRRCTHINGLLGLPVPMVNDDMPILFSRTPSFPPNSYNDEVINSLRLPVNAINVHSSRMPIDTVSGLQYFTRLQNVSVREKAIPKLGLVPVTENWREQLRSLTQNTFLPMVAGQDESSKHAAAVIKDSKTARQTRRSASKPALYSASTGRLIPQSSSGGRRSASAAVPSSVLADYEHIVAGPNLEAVVFSMLSQILQTEDVNAVQSWLISANDREKGLVSDLIRCAVANKEEYYTLFPTGEPMEPAIDVRHDLKLPPISENPDVKFDRLVIEDSSFQNTTDGKHLAMTSDHTLINENSQKTEKTQKEPTQQQINVNKTTKKMTKNKQKNAPAKTQIRKTEAVLAPGGKKSVWQPKQSVVPANAQ